METGVFLRIYMYIQGIGPFVLIFLVATKNTELNLIHRLKSRIRPILYIQEARY